MEDGFLGSAGRGMEARDGGRTVDSWQRVGKLSFDIRFFLGDERRFHLRPSHNGE